MRALRGSTVVARGVGRDDLGVVNKRHLLENGAPAGPLDRCLESAIAGRESARGVFSGRMRGVSSRV